MAAPSRRVRARILVKLSARIGDENSEMVSVRDVSPDGCSILTRNVPEKGSRVVLWIGEDTMPMIRMEAKVANLIPTNVVGVIRVGMFFIPPQVNPQAQTKAWHALFRRVMKSGVVDVPPQETVRPTPQR